VIRLTEVRVPPQAEALVLEVLRSGQLAQGDVVSQLESKFAELHCVPHAVAVNNGTTALIAALQALEVGPGDEVVTTPFTFVATLNAILAVGATARFVDIGDDFNIDVDQMGGVINDTTRVLMPVHLYGLMADMTAIAELASSHGVRVIEDAAQAVGARRGRHTAGAFDVGTFSLYATKNVWTGEGGVVTTTDDHVADRLRLLRNQGMRERYVYEVAGFNYRLTNLAAAVGLPQLDTLDEMTDRRQRVAASLIDGLSGIPGLVLPPVPADAHHVFHQFTIRLTDEASVMRDDFIEQLADRGVASGVYYPKVVSDYDCYLGHPLIVDDPVPNARKMASQVVSLPVHQHLSDADVEQIIEAARSVCAA